MNHLFCHAENKKCNFCGETKNNVKFQTLDLKKYVPVCDTCYSQIIFPFNFEKKKISYKKNNM